MNDTDSNQQSGLNKLISIIKQYISLLVEDTKLSVTEKLTRLLATIALASLLTVIAMVALVFLSIAAAIALAGVFTPHWAFVIVAAFYIIIMIVLYTCRKTLLINPIARFLSSLLLTPPQTQENTNAQSPAVPRQ